MNLDGRDLVKGFDLTKEKIKWSDLQNFKTYEPEGLEH